MTSPAVFRPPRRVRQFVSTRTLASLLSMLYALTYTALLGPEKRSVLTFLFTSSMVFTVILTSGLSLHIRSRPPSEIESSLVHSYLLLSFGAALLASILSTSALMIYGSYSATLPGVLIFLCFLYSFLSTLTLSLIDCLIAVGRIKFSMFYDFLLVLLQILIGIVFVIINQTSEFVSIIISFVASYTIISFSILALIISHYPMDILNLKRSIKSFVSVAKSLFVVGIANGVVDRIDKLSIGLLLPLEVLGKYALTTGVLTFGRFLPEAFSKTILFEREDAACRYPKPKVPKNEILLIFGSLLLSIGAAELIVFLFGEEWNLSFTFTIAFVTQELVRAIYLLNISNSMLTKQDYVVGKSSQYLLTLSVIFIPLCTFFLGIVGPAIALTLIYLTMILYMQIADSRGKEN